MEKKWIVKTKKYEDLIAQILFSRGVIDDFNQDKINKFLNPDFDLDFFDPFLLNDFQKAFDRILLAIKNNEKIGIFADYDADGIPGAALLYRTLEKFNIKPIVYIPTRQAGYGFNQSGIDYLVSEKVSLIISIDLGIREFQMSEHLFNKKIDLIITDHHNPDEKLPKALAVVNPKIKNSKYPFCELSGAGVVFKFVQALHKQFPKIIDEKFLKWNLDLVAISTISDVVPLISENRTIAKFGLKVLQKSRNLGVKSIIELSKINPETINSGTVGFQIGPRINAPGRIDHATYAFEALITEDLYEAQKLAAVLNQKNEERQYAMEIINEKSSKKIDREKLYLKKIIILSGSDWSKGVIGPAASRLVEKYSRPVILFKEDKDFFVGSARSFGDFDIYSVIKNSSKFLETFGGHRGACGLKVKSENYEKFKKSIENYCQKNISDEDLIPKIEIDAVVDADSINLNIVKELKKLEPFGMGNPRPNIIIKNLILDNKRKVGSDSQHMQFYFKSKYKSFKAIVFNVSDDHANLEINKKYDVVIFPEENYWNGKTSIDLKIIDLKESDDEKKPKK